jgi:hypothetical protein
VDGFEDIFVHWLEVEAFVAPIQSNRRAPALYPEVHRALTRATPRMDLPTTHAVFLSDASQDAETAQRLCESVCKDGKPFLSLSTPGGDSQNRQVLNVLLNIIIFHQELSVAIEAPSINTNHPHSSFDNHPNAPGAARHREPHRCRRAGCVAHPRPRAACAHAVGDELRERRRRRKSEDGHPARRG